MTVKTLKLNGTGAVREAIVRLTTSGVTGDPVVLDINVTQDFLVQKLEATETLPEDGLEISVLGDMKDTVKITSNVPFAASVVYQESDPDKDWLAVGQADYDAGEGVKVGFSTLTINVTGSDRWATLHFATTGEFGTPITFDVKVTQKGEINPVTLAKTDQFNGDSICIYWTGDVVYDKYKVVVTEQGNESNALATIEVEKPADATNQTEFYANLSKDATVSAFNGNISAKVIPVLPGDTDGTPSAAVSGNAQWADGTGDGSSAASPITIANGRHLSNVKNKLDGYFQLVADFTVSADPFAPIGQKDAPFTGQFDGNSKTITGLTLRNNNAGSGSTGIFGQISSTAVVKDFTITDPDVLIVAPGATGAPTYAFDGTLGHGVVVGYNDGGHISGVDIVTKNVMQFPSTAMAGGIAGVNNNKGTIEDCHISGTGSFLLKGEASSMGSVFFGGIVGANYGMGDVGDVNLDLTALSKVINCSNGIELRASPVRPSGELVMIGGIVGGSDGIIESCYNTGDIVTLGTNIYMGGILGATLSADQATSKAQDHKTFGSVIKYCFNSGLINPQATTVGGGGIAGHFGLPSSGAKLGNAYIQECYNSGEVKCTKSGGPVTIGGLVGIGPRADIKNCYNSGAVSSAGNATTARVLCGGLIGDQSTLSRVYNSYNSASVNVETAGATAVRVAAPLFGAVRPGNSRYAVLDHVYANKTVQPAMEFSGSGSAIVMIGYVWGYLSENDKNSFESNTSGDNATKFSIIAPTPNVDGDENDGSGVPYAVNTTICTDTFVLPEENLKTSLFWTDASFSTSYWTITNGAFPTLKNVVTAN